MEGDVSSTRKPPPHEEEKEEQGIFFLGFKESKFPQILKRYDHHHDA
jgi:hypothetical protein